MFGSEGDYLTSVLLASGYRIDDKNKKKQENGYIVPWAPFQLLSTEELTDAQNAPQVSCTVFPTDGLNLVQREIIPGSVSLFSYIRAF